MALASFQDLCESLCGLAGMDPPPMLSDENGITAFTIVADEVEIGIVSTEEGGEPGVLMVTDFGLLDEAGELEGLRAALNANFLMSGFNSAWFVRDPATGRLSARQCSLLSRISATDLYANLLRSAEAATRWRGVRFARNDAGDQRLDPVQVYEGRG
jgi:hypothetical protein